METKLPPPKIPAADSAMLTNEISAAYPNAIELGSNRATFRGITFLIIPVGIMVFLLFIWITVGLITKGEFEYALIIGLTSLVMLFVLILGVRLENFTYFEQPTLFNRKTKQVHFFRVKMQWLKPFSHWAPTITTYDWASVRPKIVSQVGGSAHVPSARAMLQLDIVESQKNGKIIANFTVGTANSASVINRQVAWEHIRRYMQGSGVALHPDATLTSDNMSSPGKAFESSFFPPNSPVLGVLNLICFPITLPMAIGAAVIAKTGFKPEWPAEILEAAGGSPLTIEEIRAQAEQELPNLKEEEPATPEHEQWA